MLTIQEMEDDRARGLDAIDDILNTATEAERSLTADERADIDYINVYVDAYTADITRARQDEGDQILRSNQEARRGWHAPTVNFNTIGTAPAHATRSLDELLWATEDVVRAGSASTEGIFRANPYGAVAPVDQVVVRSEAGAEGTLAPRISEVLPDQRAAVRSFQKTVADMALFGMMIDPTARNSRDGFQVARSHRLFADRWNHVMRAMDVDTSGEGGTWVPTGIGASMHEKVRAMGKIAPLFARIDIPTNPWKMPIEGADATAYRVAEPTGDTESKPTASTPGTVAATFDAEIFGGRVLFSRSLEADSALAVLPYVTMKLARAFYIAEERAILDGDTDGTHQDTDVQAIGATDARTAWDGLRKRALAETTQATTATTAANLGLIRKSMKKWGVDPLDCAFIIGVSGYHALLADTNLLTVDKMGPNATILNGQIGSVHGVPVIVSEYVREDLNATGFNDGITTTKTYSLCVNRNEWAFGQRMALDVEVDDSIYRETFQRVVVAFQRQDFQSIAEASTDDTTSIGYNVTSGS